MKIRLIRNATIVLSYGKKTFLIDPFFAPKGAYAAFPNTANQVGNPTVNLPLPIEEMIDVDAVIVTHLHVDHFDPTAIEVLPKDITVIAQSDVDAEVIREKGFHNVQTLYETSTIGDIRLNQTSGQHGTGEIGLIMGQVSGVVFQHPDEQTLYIAGDTIWCEDVEKAIETHKPEVIVVNGGSAQFLQGDPITMSKEDIYRTYEEAPEASIIVAHMEAVNHCLLTRKELRSFIEEKRLSSSILVPEDGETISF
ncbi:MBL fold metallo-hydrolase [Paenibacillus sp. GSMTC-2017]|uniref:MBL fold metallo-hydrolase n=1 Tax=Paenibacillus sp. GSMTC-2017 TaxID=2794350 RepID=UPI0018D96FC4|nr:MBL fold metallo-hydrolase [Paenibacillus sp. GSMTC-2017]MBH5320470.1 MBL fold metallo-hydrolase [Paenibacillus sp. GSMTC-2017]